VREIATDFFLGLSGGLEAKQGEYNKKYLVAIHLSESSL